MTALSALPPAFLLPAWNNSQLILFASRRLSRNTQCQFSTSRARASEAVESSQRTLTRQYTEVELNGVKKVVRTYASKKERRLRENIEVIKSKIERYGGISSTTQSEAERQNEQQRERAILLHYNKKQQATQVNKEQQRKKAMRTHNRPKDRGTEHINTSPLNRLLSSVEQSEQHNFRTQQGRDCESAEAVGVRNSKLLIEELPSAGNGQVKHQQALEGNENGEGENHRDADKSFKRTRISGSRTYQSLMPAARSKHGQGVKPPTLSLKAQQGKKPKLYYKVKGDQAEPQLAIRRMGIEETAGTGSSGRSFRSIDMTALNTKRTISPSGHSQSGDSHSQEPAGPKKSLLEELFPEEAAKMKQQSQAAVSEPREAPKLSLPGMNDMQHESASIGKAEIIPRRTSTTPTQPTKEIGALLILENAVPDLIEADFRRVPPKGKHISEWNPIYNPTAIVPARVGSLARCTGKYYIVFDSWAGAKAWRDRLKSLHRIVQQYAPTSLNSSVIPPNGFVSSGEDIGELLTEYSIFSHSTVPKLRLYAKPDADPNVKEEFRQVLARLQPDKRTIFRPGRSVLLWIDGWTGSTVEMITEMIKQNGRERHMLWNEEASKLPVEAYANDTAPRQEDTPHDEIDSKQQQPKKWIVTLRDEAEARRFIRVWHLKLLPNWQEIRPSNGDDYDSDGDGDGDGGSEEPWPVVRTELLW